MTTDSRGKDSQIPFSLSEFVSAYRKAALTNKKNNNNHLHNQPPAMEGNSKHNTKNPESSTFNEADHDEAFVNLVEDICQALADLPEARERVQNAMESRLLARTNPRVCPECGKLRD
jgi:hypothetical protein